MLEKLKEEFEKHECAVVSITEGIIPEIIIDKFPHVVEISHGGRRVWALGNFVIKAADIGKYGIHATPVDGLTSEVNTWLKFKDRIPLVDKIAFLYVGEVNDINVYVIEPKLIVKEEWSPNILDKANTVLAKHAWREGEFRIQNMLYNPRDGQVKFFDVFPK